MPLYLGHRTAELLLEKPLVDHLSPAFSERMDHCLASRTDLSMLDLQVLKDIPTPYDVLVSSPREIRRWKGIRCHLITSPPPAGSFIEISPDVFVASPAYCLTQRAQELSLAQTVALGMRFCGTFALDKRRPSGIRSRNPLTTAEDLASFVERSENMNGIPRARRAIKLVQEGSASPMETISQMVFCFPRKLHGFGFSLPYMNYEEFLSQSAKKLVDKDFIRIDVYWKNHAFGLEYQGKYAHSSATNISADIARQLAAERSGIELQMITIEQIRNQEQRLEIARKIGNRIGEQFPTDKRFLVANQRLVDDLLQTTVT